MKAFVTSGIVSIGLIMAALAVNRTLEQSTDEVRARAVAGVAAATIFRNNQLVDRRRAEPGLALNATDRYLANWLYSLRYLQPMRVTVNGRPLTFRIDELVLNIRQSGFDENGPERQPWAMLEGLHYDQLPRPVLEVVLASQLERYGYYTDPRLWPVVDLEEWKQLPAPIQKIAAYGMTWEWAGRRFPERYGLTLPESARILVSIGIVESLFDLDKTDNANSRTGNVDRGYFQISDMVRSDLERLPEFCAYRPDDYYRPWVSIEAASYLMFERLMKIADGNIPRAVGMYNVGPKGSSKLAEGYFLAVADRYRDTFVQGLSYSPTRYFMLNMAQKDYFAQIESDFLFVHTAAGSTRG